MDPLTLAKAWMLIKPVQRIKDWRKKKKEQKETIMFEALKEKAKDGVKSTTMGMAALIVMAGVFLQERPEVIQAIVPDNYEGLALSVVGVLVAIARLRTLGK